MRLRDALRGPDEDEFGNGDTVTVSDGDDVLYRGGGDSDDDPKPPAPQRMWPFMRETRVRLVRLEERMSILMRIIIIGFFLTILATVTGYLMTTVLP